MIIILICLFRLLAFFSCLVEIVVLFITECSWLGIPPLPLRSSWRILVLSFPYFSILAKLQSSATAQFLFRFVLCCRVLQWRVEKPTFWASFHRRKDSFYWEIKKEGSWAHFRYLALGQPIPIIYSAFLVWNCIILEGNFKGGSIGSFKVFYVGWRVEPRIGGYLWWRSTSDPYYFQPSISRALFVVMLQP